MTHLERRRGSFRTYVTSHSLFFTVLCVSATFCVSFHAGSSFCQYLAFIKIFHRESSPMLVLFHFMPGHSESCHGRANEMEGSHADFACQHTHLYPTILMDRRMHFPWIQWCSLHAVFTITVLHRGWGTIIWEVKLFTFYTFSSILMSTNYRQFVFSV
jgi:hypothetical protein